jgi:hypothetical protein
MIASQGLVAEYETSFSQVKCFHAIFEEDERAPFSAESEEKRWEIGTIPLAYIGRSCALVSPARI